MAAEFGVSGYITGEEDTQHISQLAHLLPIPSPFDKEGKSNTFDILKWLDQAANNRAGIVLCDFGSPQQDTVLDAFIGRLSEQALVVAAGPNDSTACYPAWNPNVLAVGPLDENDKILREVGPLQGPTEYAAFDPDRGKPELFAPATVKGSPLAMVLRDPSLRGSSFACLHVVAAAVLVWSTDPGQAAGEVRRVLVSTARPIPGLVDGKPVVYCKLDTRAALKLVRGNLIKATLLSGPLELNELIAACTLAPSVANWIIDELRNEGQLIRTSGKRGDIYQLAPARAVLASEPPPA
jgi:hypothetical protein